MVDYFYGHHLQEEVAGSTVYRSLGRTLFAKTALGKYLAKFIIIFNNIRLLYNTISFRAKSLWYL